MVICLIVQVVAAGLAILSRMHFSKYKVWLRYVVLILLVSSTCAEILYVQGRSGKPETQAVLTRADYDGEVKTEDIRLSIDDKEYSYAMEIAPREYTEEEFYERVQTQVTQLEATILGDNPDAEHVTQELDLPAEDEDGVFSYTWSSDRPDIISSYGKVNLEEVGESEIVILTLTVSYHTYEYEQEFPLAVVKQTRRKDGITRAEEALHRLEQETRTDKNVTLPQQYENVRIQIKKEDTQPFMQCLLAGIVLACAVPAVWYLKKREQEKKKNNALILSYPFFVNRLWLLLGTGMTVQMGIRQILSEMKEDMCLKRELEYAMHCLQTGGEESQVYEQLGRRLGLPEYRHLFRQLAQHVRVGTKDLRNLMELEMQTALKKRREFAKKKGEEASTKLLFPMIVLLALVMLLIVYPAMTGL